MAEFKDPACAEIILPLVKHAHAFVRMGALRALKELRCKDTLKPALEGVTPAQATWKPKGGDHSIGQLANHLLFWNSQQLAKFKHVAEPKYGGNNDETFNAFDAARWAETRQQLDRVLSELEKLVSEADAQTVQAWAPTLGRMATHNAYHTGQILSLRKMQGAWDPEKGVK